MQPPAAANPGSVLSWAHVKDVLQLPDKVSAPAGLAVVQQVSPIPFIRWASVSAGSLPFD